MADLGFFKGEIRVARGSMRGCGEGVPLLTVRGFGRGLTLHIKKIEYGALKWHILNFDAFLRLIINLKDLLLHSPEHVVQMYITFQELGRPSSQFDQLLFHMVQR